MLQLIATGGEDRKVNVWKLTNASNLYSFAGHNSEVECVCFDPHENYLISGSRGGGLRVYDLGEVSGRETVAQNVFVVSCNL